MIIGWLSPTSLLVSLYRQSHTQNRETMKFQELNEYIPYARFGKEKSLIMEPYPNIRLLLPGRHAEDTSPKGGDFCVVVTDPKINWNNHQFTHAGIFNDIEVKYEDNPELTRALMNEYLEVIVGGKEPSAKSIKAINLSGMDALTFLYGTQCLGVAEHRRYHMHEAKFGGRYLPFRFAAGIAEGLWTADMGSEVQKYGRPAVERLEKSNGIPRLTQE